jgi:hypothetical protein
MLEILLMLCLDPSFVIHTFWNVIMWIFVIFFVEGLVDLNVQLVPSLSPYRCLKFIHGLHKVGPSYVYVATSFYKWLKGHHIINVLDNMGPEKVGNVDWEYREENIRLRIFVALDVRL